MHDSVLERSNIKLIDSGFKKSASGQAPIAPTIIANVGELRRTDIKQISLDGKVKKVATGDEENPRTEKEGIMITGNDKNTCFYEFKHGCYGTIGGCRKPHIGKQNIKISKDVYTPNICTACKPQFINAVKTGKCV